MLETLSFELAQNIIVAKICLVVAMSLGITGIVTKKIKSWVFLVGIGLCMGLAYYSLVHNLELPLWGLVGDEITISAMYTTFAHHSFFSDFAYHHLPPFYPPLFFIVIALGGKLLDLNGIATAKLGATLTFIFFPIIVYAIQKLYWRGKKKFAQAEVAFLSAPLLILTFVNVDEVIGKPYELFAAVGAVYWLLFLYLELKKNDWSYKKALIFGITGGLIFMTYYLWLIFAVIALSLLSLGISKENQFKFFMRATLTLGLTFLVSLPFLLPLIKVYASQGSENWQAALFTITNINWRTLFFDTFSWKSLLMLIGFIAIIYNYRLEKNKPLLAAMVTVYVWWGMGLITLLLFSVPMQEFRGFYFFLPTVLAVGLSLGIAQGWDYLEKYKNSGSIKIVMSLAGLVLFIQLSILGTFIDEPIVHQRLIASKVAPANLKSLSTFLKDHSNDELTLNAVPSLSAWVPINTVIYFNQHNSHPASHFSNRLAYIESLAAARDEQEFFELTKVSPSGPIRRLILYRKGSGYPLFFHVDKIMTGFEEISLIIPADLISDKYFKKVYSVESYEVWEVR